MITPATFAAISENLQCAVAEMQFQSYVWGKIDPSDITAAHIPGNIA
jgi:hypothetical protein